MAEREVNTGRELERRVADLYRKMGAKKVEHDVLLAGNQIDVYVELGTPGPHQHRLAVEVKDWAKPVGVDIVNEFALIVRLLRDKGLIDEGVIVSANGFSKPAREAAQTHGICLLELSDLEPVEAGRAPLPIQEASPPLTLLPSETPETILIPAGPFWMGSPADDPQAYPNEVPRHRLELPAYRIGRYPVTNVQYACFVRQTGYRPPAYWENGEFPPGLEDHPVVEVSYEDALAYCVWLSTVTRKRYRLPTEEEWEKAARGGLPETRRYPWGDEWEPERCNTKEAGRGGTTPVRAFEERNQSPFGVVDMAGNVWEWTESWYERYPDSPHESPRYGQTLRVVRGGSWRNNCRAARISCRGRYPPGTQRPYLGFRVVLDTIEPSPEPTPPPAKAEPSPTPPGEKITILFLAADPTDATRLRLGEEMREIDEKLRLARHRERFELCQRWSVRAADISQALLDVQPQIVHFSGHGTAAGALCFEDQMGGSFPIQPDALADLFKQFADRVRCVILNTCYSAAQARAIARHIDYTIGVSQAIEDKAAIAFAVGFYQALGAKRTIEEAYELGRTHVEMHNLPDHHAFILFKKGAMQP